MLCAALLRSFRGQHSEKMKGSGPGNWDPREGQQPFRPNPNGVGDRTTTLRRLLIGAGVKLLSLQNWQIREFFLQRLWTFVPGHLSSHSALYSYGIFAPLTLWRLSVSLRSLVQALGSCPASGARWSSAMPPSLG